MDIAEIKKSMDNALARIVLSTVQFIPIKVGVQKLIGTLRGTEAAYITDLELNSVATYGLLPMFSDEALRSIVDILISKQYLSAKPSKFKPVLVITDAGADFLQSAFMENFGFVDQIADNQIRVMQDSKTLLFDQLKKIRLRIAKREQISAFLVCTDAQLREIVAKLPATPGEFHEIKGLKKHFASKYARQFSESIKKWRAIESS